MQQQMAEAEKEQEERKDEKDEDEEMQIVEPGQIDEKAEEKEQ